MKSYIKSEIIIDNNGKKIYGILYLPLIEGKISIVVYSHELANNHRRGIDYAKYLAANGIGCYVFDYCGGSTSNRNTCLGHRLYDWGSEDYKTDCAFNSYLLFSDITSTAPGAMGTNQIMLTPSYQTANGVCSVGPTGIVSRGPASNTNYVRPVLYLRADMIIGGGTRTWSDPYYTIDPNDSKRYWYFTTCTYSNPCSHPNYSVTSYDNALATGQNVYIGQDLTRYYACATFDHELCLSQPYTQYELII